jgi:hypothetical protein
MCRKPNIGLQRTSRRQRAAAEAGSLGGFLRSLVVAFAISGCLLSSRVGFSGQAEGLPRTSWQFSDEAEARVLLTSDSKAAQIKGLDKLWAINSEVWLEDRAIVDRLKSLVGSPSSEPEVRSSILWLFRYSNSFNQVQSVANRLAADESNAPLAYESARALTFEEPWNPVSPELKDVFARSSGILRRYAAISVGRHYRPGLEPSVAAAVIRELVETFSDPQIPPAVRGDAIEAAGTFIDEPAVQAALLKMLAPERRFFGVSGEHYALSSLVPTIHSLGRSKSPEARERLSHFCEELDSIPEGQRWDVEGALNFELRNP